jgi:predicted phage terminase large subunit-like protein
MATSRPLRKSSPQPLAFLEQARIPTLHEIQSEKQRRATEKARRELAAGAALSLYTFVKLAWRELEPEHKFVGGWALAAMCRHLEAITRGTLLDMGLMNRLLMNVPPGMMKSLLVGVFWPAWEWGPMGMPHLSYFGTAYKVELAIRDSRKMRDLIESDWYQEHWGDKFRLTRRGEGDFANDKGGWRLAVAFDGLTGGRADRVLVDDPHSTEKAESEAERKTAIRIFRESLHSRVNNDKSAIVIIMQRLHENDVSGTAIRLGLDYIHLMLPMEYEPNRQCRTPIGFEDPRTMEGELLFPERFDQAFLKRERKVMTAYAQAGQWQQRPTPREGGMFKRAWFRRVPAAPAGVRWCRHFDLAATDEKYAQTGTAQTAGFLLGKDEASGMLYIAHVETVRLENVHPFIKNTCDADRARYPRYEVSLPQDPGQAGKVQKRSMAALLAGFDVRFEIESGEKPTRAEPFAAQCEVGNVAIVDPPRLEGTPEPPWIEEMLNQLTNFPGGVLKDIVDAASGAYANLLKPPRYVPPVSNIEGLNIYQR